MFDIYDLSLFFIAILLLGHWWRTSEQKIQALAKAKKHCKHSDLQLLDQTLVFQKYKFEKDSRGRIRLCRVYEFDFSKDGGEERHHGEIMLAGFFVVRIVLELEHLDVTEF